MTNEEAFKNGALAMQARIVAWLATQGFMHLAPEVLALDPPEYSEPEKA